MTDPLPKLGLFSKFLAGMQFIVIPAHGGEYDNICLGHCPAGGNIFLTYSPIIKKFPGHGIFSFGMNVKAYRWEHEPRAPTGSLTLLAKISPSLDKAAENIHRVFANTDGISLPHS
jgi:hypothetical protein